ncbi:MAG: hypothetical protein QOI86_2779 [Actinomycetota bacterium]|jgi:hypothetical protein|nr:hypothetical protein [Actinomycetota bacterium]
MDPDRHVLVTAGPGFKQGARSRVPIDPKNGSIRPVRPVAVDGAGVRKTFPVESLEDLAGAEWPTSSVRQISPAGTHAGMLGGRHADDPGDPRAETALQVRPDSGPGRGVIQAGAVQAPQW